MSYTQNSAGPSQTSSVVRAGLVGALLASAFTTFPANAMEGPVQPIALSSGYHSHLVNSTNAQLIKSFGVADHINTLPPLEDQVSGLYSKIFADESPLDEESTKIYFDHAWDLYVE